MWLTTRFSTEHADQVRDKLVLLIPLKCERYFNDGRIDDVSRKAVEAYRRLLNFCAKANTACAVTPIKTLGGVEYSHFTDNYAAPGGVEKLSVFRFCGTKPKYAPAFCVQPDMEQVFMKGDKTLKPYVLYHLPTGRKAKYSPHNCEQLALHVLRFTYNKIMAEYAHGGWLGKLFSLFFGTMTKEDMEIALKGLDEERLIKDSGDGITRLAQCF